MKPTTKFIHYFNRKNWKMNYVNQLFLWSAILILGMGNSKAQSFSGTYSFAGTVANVSSLNYNGSAITNLTVSALTKSGVTTSSSSGNSRASGWGTGSTNGAASAGGSVDLAKYFEFTITAGSGYTISNPTLTFGVGRSATGPRRFQWRSNLDSYGSAISVGTVNSSISHSSGVLETPDGTSGYTGNIITVTTSGQTSITFRFYAYGAEATSGTGGLEGNLSFGGTLVASSSTPTITTPTVSAITDVSATLGATITNDGGSSISARGTVYKTSSSVTATDNALDEGGTSVAAFSHNRTGLTPQTQYFYAGYATNTSGTALSTEASFRTLSTAPTAQSSGVTATSFSSSQINLTISPASFPVTGATQAGYLVIYSTATPTFASSNGQAPSAGVGTIFATPSTILPTTPSTSINITGLISATSYNFLVIPYTWDGTNASTYNYLTASAPTANATTNSGSPVVTTPTVSAITHNTATLGATVSSDGGSTLIARGTAFKTTSPVIASDNQLAEGGTSVSSFSHNRTGLNSETEYFFVGYATNGSSTSISSEGSFRTLSSPPTSQAGLSASVVSTSQIDLSITTATFPASGATQAGYVVIYSTGTPTFISSNGQAPAAGVGTLVATTSTALPTTPNTSISVTGLSQSTQYNFLVIPYTWDGTNTTTYNYLTASAPTANATTQANTLIAAWDFNGESSPTSSISDTSNSSLINIPSLTRGPAAISSSGSNSFRTTGFQNNGISTSNTDYFQTVLQSNTHNLSIKSIDARFVGTSSFYASPGVTSQFAYSFDGVNFTLIGSPQTSTSLTLQFDISGTTALQNIPAGTSVTFRYYASGQTSTGGWGFSSSAPKVYGLQISGQVVINTDPIINVSPTGLTSFIQTSSTPSAEQSYTVSGNNLSSQVSIVPPSGFEISTGTGTSFSATNPINLAVTGGDIVGEPVTIYVRQSSNTLGAVSGNITHTSTGANNPNVAVSGTRTGTYYSKAIGNLNDLNTWGLNADGTGSSPSNFTSDGVIYEIRNRAIATIDGNWIVSGTSSKVVVGDGTSSTDFIIPSGFSFTGTLDVNSAAELTLENSSFPTLGNLAANSTLEYNNVSVTLSTSTSYKNLKLSGSGTKTLPGGTTTISGNLVLDNCTLDGSSASPFSTIELAGDLTYIGTVTPPAAANSITLATTGTGSGTQTFTGAGNTLRWFRIQTTTANTILLSNTGGSTNLFLGNSSGGGITLADGSLLNMNGNDFQLFNGTAVSAAFVMTTGTVSTTSATDFIIERTGNGNLGTLRFTSGSNTIGNLTLNHTGTSNTLTIGNALQVKGTITVTSGTLASGGNITLKSDATGTARVAESGGSITGNVTVERFIPGSSGRKYRYLAAPFATGPTLATSWQQQIHITGPGTGGSLCPSPSPNSNGFDATQTNAPSMFTFNETTAVNTNTPGNNGGTVYNNAWVTVPNTSSTTLQAGKGYKVFVRGNKSQGCDLVNGTNPSPNDVTLSGSGVLVQGAFNFSVTFSSSNGEGWNLVGNPYPCAIDWDAAGWTKTNIEDKIWIFRPAGNHFATYNALSGGANFGSNIIESGSAFFVHAVSASPVLAANESVKVGTSPSVQLFKNQLKKLSLTFVKVGQQQDEIVVGMAADATDANDAFDAEKMSNPALNVYARSSDGKQQAINIFKAAQPETRVPLGINTTFTGEHRFSFKGETEFNAYDVLLEDRYAGIIQMVNDRPSYTFEINSDPASYGEGRFSLLFVDRGDFDYLKRVKSIYSSVTASLNAYPNPSKGLVQLQTSNLQGKLAEVKVYNAIGAEIQRMEQAIDKGICSFSLDLSDQASGVYFVEVSDNQGNTRKAKVVKSNN
ncbi:MAG: T9SS type A sorting domain-containing protein [Bacteroidetes bacterium]|nr:T9SS type A sorting domain-containing protein [Bacteroidota bacterium]